MIIIILKKNLRRLTITSKSCLELLILVGQIRIIPTVVHSIV